MKIKCANCGIDFERRPSSIRRTNKHFCSKNCMKLSYRGANHPRFNQIKVECYYCGKMHFKRQDVKSTHIFCSRDCHHKWRKTITGANHPLFKKIEVNCGSCGTKILKSPSIIKLRNNHFCNSQCRSRWMKQFVGKKSFAYRKIDVKCNYCGAKLERIPFHIKKFKKFFCDFSCMGKWQSEHNLGEHNPFWKGRISFEPYGLEFNYAFKEKIRIRDGRCCIICNRSEEELQEQLCVHHIDYIKINNFLQNCVSLCRKHHADTNGNRIHWTKFFQSLLAEKYRYEYTANQKIIVDFTKIIQQETHEVAK